MPGPKVTWIPAAPVFAKGIDRYLRPADREEIHLSTGSTPEPVLRKCIELSDKSWVAMIDGDFAALCGVGGGTLLGQGGRPWLVASAVVERHPWLFVKRSQLLVDEMGREYGTLYNWVWDGHEAAKKWLRLVGFTLEEPAPYGPYQAPFRRFWRSPCVTSPQPD